MDIIDFRARPAIPAFAASGDNRLHAGLLAAKSRSMPNETVESFVAKMDELGIAKTVVPARDVETTFGFRVPNETVSELVATASGRFVGFGAVDPNKGMEAVREADRAINSLGLKGISLDPYMHRRRASDAKYYPIYAKCIELGVPVLLTGGPAPYIPDVYIDDCGPSAVDQVATDFPELTLIISHGLYPFVTEMIAITARHSNVYFEFSGFDHYPGSHLYVEAANSFIEDKVLYASAHPFTDMALGLERVSKLAFRDEVRTKFFSLNARKVLGLN